MKYEEPEMEVILLEGEDVLTLSIGDVGTDDDMEPGKEVWSSLF